MHICRKISEPKRKCCSNGYLCFLLTLRLLIFKYVSVHGLFCCTNLTPFIPLLYSFYERFYERHFAPPGKDATNSSRKRIAWNVACFRVAGRKVAMRKHEIVITWRVFVWRLFAFSPRKHAYTTWHKSATIIVVIERKKCIIQE